MRWVLLVYRIPREPSRHRVAVWRKLRDLGALYLQDGVAAAQREGGRGRGDPLGGKARDRGRGSRVGGNLPFLTGEGLQGHHRRGRAPAAQGPDGRECVGAARQARARVQSGEAPRLLSLPAAPPGGGGAQGRPRSRKGQRRVSRDVRHRGQEMMLWATRRGCHVDRTACIWLIRRFIDPEAAFSFFGDPAEAPEEAELFDVVGARLSHRGEDCSFETFLKDYELEDRVLHEIAEIVHDADLMDEKHGRPESEGLDAIVRGMQLALPDDETLTFHTDVLYEGLYAYLSREVL